MGSGLGALYCAASYATVSLAARYRDQQAFMTVFLGGMVVRMFVALGAMACVLVVLPVRAVPFVGAFGIVFLAGLVGEVFAATRRLKEPAVEA